jgi:CRP-like cAMP-binding protein
MGNRLLKLLPSKELERFLRPVKVEHAAVLYEQDGVIHDVYFPTTALISLVVPLQDGTAIEAAMVGGDGIVGGNSAINGQTSSNRAIVQIAGDALSIDAPTVRRLARTDPQVHSLIAKHENMVLAQCQQSAACNAAHSVHERFAKWLLLARDRVGQNNLGLTQEFVAEMLGVRRTTVTVEALQFQQAGLIRYRRGHIEILKPDDLKDAACECYEVIRRRFCRLLDPGQNLAAST